MYKAAHVCHSIVKALFWIVKTKNEQHKQLKAYVICVVYDTKGLPFSFNFILLTTNLYAVIDVCTLYRGWYQETAVESISLLQSPSSRICCCINSPLIIWINFVYTYFPSFLFIFSVPQVSLSILFWYFSELNGITGIINAYWFLFNIIFIHSTKS